MVDEIPAISGFDATFYPFDKTHKALQHSGNSFLHYLFSVFTCAGSKLSGRASVCGEQCTSILQRKDFES